MRILDEIRAYSGDLDYTQLAMKIQEMNDRENHSLHSGYQVFPIKGMAKEKRLLTTPSTGSYKESILDHHVQRKSKCVFHDQL